MTKVKEMLETLEKDLRDKRQYSAADKLLPIIAEAGKEKEEILKKLEQKKTVAKVSFESCLMDKCYQEAQLEQRTMDVLKEVIEIVKNGGRNV